MSEKTERGKAAIIVRNENGETMEYVTSAGSNLSISLLLEDAGILTDELSRHLRTDS